MGAAAAVAAAAVAAAAVASSVAAGSGTNSRRPHCFFGWVCWWVCLPQLLPAFWKFRKQEPTWPCLFAAWLTKGCIERSLCPVFPPQRLLHQWLVIWRAFARAVLRSESAPLLWLGRMASYHL